MAVLFGPVFYSLKMVNAKQALQLIAWHYKVHLVIRCFFLRSLFWINSSEFWLEILHLACLN